MMLVNVEISLEKILTSAAVSAALAALIFLRKVTFNYVVVPVAKYVWNLLRVGQLASDTSQRVQALESEVKTNGGSSIRDAVNKLMLNQEALIESEPRAMFRCDTEGKNVFVNRSFAHLCGVGKRDLMGHKWRSFIQGIDDYDFASKRAFSDQRSMTIETELQSMQGHRYQVRISLFPVLNGAQYAGVIEVVKELLADEPANKLIAEV